MAVITIGSQKGGPGKSTCATNLAVCLKLQGYQVILVDADIQRNSSNWSEYRDEQDNLISIPTVQKLGNVCQTLKELNNHYDYVIVDAAGRDSRELRTALFASHLLVVPFRASQFDLDTITKMNEIVEDARDKNQYLVVRSLINQAPTQTLNTEVADTKAVLKQCAQFPAFKTIVKARKAFRQAIVEGKSAIEMRDSKAAGEMFSLVHEIQTTINTEFRVNA